jgi:hypothetical protein
MQCGLNFPKAGFGLFFLQRVGLCKKQDVNIEYLSKFWVDWIHAWVCEMNRLCFSVMMTWIMTQARINTELEKELGEDAAPAKLLARLLQVMNTRVNLLCFCFCCKLLCVNSLVIVLE